MATPLPPLALGIARPESEATGLPMGVEELARTKAAPALLGTGLQPGVEQRGRDRRMQFVGPIQGTQIVNGILSDGTSARTQEIQAAAGTASTAAPATATSSAPPVLQFMSPLGRGAPAGSASAFGGPVPVGGGQRSRGERLLARLARRGDATAAATLFNAEQRNADREATQNFALKQDQQRADRNQSEGLLEFQRRQQLERDGQASRTALQEDAQTHQLDVMQFQTAAQAEENRLESERKKGFSVVPLVPGDPSKGNAVLRGNGELFNLLPGTKPEEGMREYPDGIVQFPGDTTPYRREDVTPPFQGIPFRTPEPRVTYTPLDFMPRESGPRITQIDGPILTDRMGNPTPGPKKTVIVDPKTGKAKPVKVEGEEDAPKSDTPSWATWLEGSK